MSSRSLLIILMVPGIFSVVPSVLKEVLERVADGWAYDSRCAVAGV